MNFFAKLFVCFVLFCICVAGNAGGKADTKLTTSEKAVLKEWKDQIIYFVMTDRFYNGDKNNDRIIDVKNPRAFHGGDLQGIIDKIGYLKNMGMTALWMTPLMDNRDKDFFNSYGYHGYWIKDFFAMEEHVGSFNTLKILSKKAKDHGISLIMDIVVNHADYDNNMNPQWFHSIGDVKDWNDPVQVEEGAIFGMPDFNQDHPEVNSFLEKMIDFWIEKSICGGIRFDAVRHVPKRFWKKYLSRIEKIHKDKDLFLFGEVLDGNPYHIASYLRYGFHGLFNYPLYYKIIESFGQSLSVESLAEMLSKNSLYRMPELMVNFIDNHDTSRFVNLCKDKRNTRLEMALKFLFSIQGIPMIYYGTEVPMEGHDELEVRADMDFSSNPQFYDYIAELSKKRLSCSPLVNGAQKVIYSKGAVLVISRIDEFQEAFVFVNNSENILSAEVKCTYKTLLSNGDELEELFTGEKIKYIDDKLYAELKPMSVSVFVSGKKGFHSGVMDQFHKRAYYPPKEFDVQVDFEISDKTDDEYDYFLVGGHQNLGNWNQKKGVKLEKRTDKRFVSVLLPAYTPIECKLVRSKNPLKPGSFEWSQGENIIVEVGGAKKNVEMIWQ